MSNAARIGVAAVTLAAIAGCHSPVWAPEPRADASGIVLEFLTAPVSPNTVARILVEHPGVPPHADRSIVHIGSATPILVRGADGQLEAGRIEDIRVGVLARIEIEDVELRSYPRQVFATRIEVPR